MNSFRWFPFARADGATNMAVDDVLLHTAAEKGIASLRFYGWSVATISLGYFQSAELRKTNARLASLPWVRRPSGGSALVHHYELTYALALPAGYSSGWMPRMHQRVMLPALTRLGLAGQIDFVENEVRMQGEFLCFKQKGAGDLVCADHKMVGSSQRKFRQALLQHGAILLARSEHAPELPGIKELTGVELSVELVQHEILDAFARETGWNPRQAAWTAAEEDGIREKVTCQYGTTEWNGRR
jgi:lipoate-protein ligase A